MANKITLAHGSGGRMMHELIDSLMMSKLGNPILREKRDSAIMRLGCGKIAFTTDSYVVRPIFFPGGDIGSLAVHGTVNDLAVCGALPLYISVGMIIEEGLDLSSLKRITASISKAAKVAGVNVVTGDTKVVEKGKCDSIFINTSGVGEIYYDALSTGRIKPGDAIIVSGPIGDHAVSVLSKREGIEFDVKVVSDSAPLNKLIYRVLDSGTDVKFMRDPTRGGVATTLNEITQNAAFGIELYEDSIPVRRGVREACELLGFDPLYLACEGRVLIIAADKDAKRVIKVLRGDRLGRGASIIGRIVTGNKGRVVMKTASGGRRIVDMLAGEQLPRIC